MLCAVALGGPRGAAADHPGGPPHASAAPRASAASSPAAVSAAGDVAAAPWVELLRVDGSINPAVAAYIEDGIARASSQHAGALVIELDTPGGLLSSAQRIVKDLLNAPLPTIVYVSPSGASAASAGTFIVEAAAIAAMAPGTPIGAAPPVGEGASEINGWSWRSGKVPLSAKKRRSSGTSSTLSRPTCGACWSRLRGAKSRSAAAWSSSRSPAPRFVVRG